MDKLYDPYEKVVTLDGGVSKLDFYAGATSTSLFALTVEGKTYRVTDVAAEELVDSLGRNSIALKMARKWPENGPKNGPKMEFLKRTYVICPN